MYETHMRVRQALWDLNKRIAEKVEEQSRLEKISNSFLEPKDEYTDTQASFHNYPDSEGIANSVLSSSSSHLAASTEETQRSSHFAAEPNSWPNYFTSLSGSGLTTGPYSGYNPFTPSPSGSDLAIGINSQRNGLTEFENAHSLPNGLWGSQIEENQRSDQAHAIETSISVRRKTTSRNNLGNSLGASPAEDTCRSNTASVPDYPETELFSTDGRSSDSDRRMAVLSDSDRDIEESMDYSRHEDDDSSKSENEMLQKSLRDAYQINRFLTLTASRRLSEEGAVGGESVTVPSSSIPSPPPEAIAGAAALLPQSLVSAGLIPGFSYPVPPYAEVQSSSPSGTDILARALVASRGPRKPRGEKKPIPSDLKDTRYYERRKRNNAAAKKSRDARKKREDEIAKKANLLQSENEILKKELQILSFAFRSMFMNSLQKGFPLDIKTERDLAEILQRIIRIENYIAEHRLVWDV